MPATWLKYFRYSFESYRSLFSQDEGLLSVETSGDLKPSFPEAEIAQMLDGVLFPDCGIPAADKFFIVFFDAREFPARLFLSDFDDPFVIEMRIGRRRRLQSYSSVWRANMTDQ